MTRKVRRNLLIAIGLGMLLLSQIACQSTTGSGLTCNPPQVRTCHTDPNGFQGCWCQ